MSLSSQDCALIQASKDGNQEEALKAIEMRANVNCKDSNGYSPLHCACLHGHIFVALTLLKHGADIHALDEDKSTPLHIACLNSHKEDGNVLVSLLLKRGAKDDILSQNKLGITPLHNASGVGLDVIVETLLKNGAKASINAQNNWGDTALHQAYDFRRDKVVSVLLKYGANPNITNKKGNTPSERSLDWNERDYVDVTQEFLLQWQQEHEHDDQPNEGLINPTTTASLVILIVAISFGVLASILHK